MVIGVLELTLAVPAATLKEKRSVVKRVINRTQQKFNVAAAEVDELDNPGGTVLGFVTVGNDRRYVNSVLDHLINHVDEMYLANIVDQCITMENY